MKKLSGLIALGLTMTMLFGMTVSAEESPRTETTDKTVEAPADLGATVTANVEGAEVKVMAESTKSVAASQAANPNVVAQAKTIVGVSGDYELSAVPGLAVDITVPEGTEVSAAKPFVASFTNSSFVVGKNYVALHMKKDGTWEVLPVAISGNTATVKFTSLSPVRFFEVVPETEKAGDDDDDDDSAEVTPVNPRTGEPAAASPKTGETVPVAGMMALICLAGVAVCASKVRYNR